MRSIYDIAEGVCLGIIAAKIVQWIWEFWRDVLAEERANAVLQAKLRLRGMSPTTIKTIQQAAASSVWVVFQRRREQEDFRWAAVGHPRWSPDTADDNAG